MSRVEYSRGNNADFILTLFGGPTLQAQHGVVRLSPYQATLLGIIAAHEDRGISRERISQLLWQATPSDLIRRRVSQLLYMIKISSGSREIISTQGEWVRLDPKLVRTDVTLFQELLRAEELRRAAQQMESGFFSLCPAATDEMEDWLEAKKLKFKADLRHQSARSWSASSSTGRWAKADEAAEVLFMLNPSNEDYLRKAVHARAMADGPEAAEALYSDFRDRRTHETDGWAPEQETIGLLERVRSLGFSQPSRVSAPGSGERETPLLGRDPELTLLSAMLNHDPPEKLHIVIITGEAGVGKTRLVREALRPATLNGLIVLDGQYTEFEREIPLNSLLESFTVPVVSKAAGKLADPWRTVILTLLPELQETDVPIPDVPYVQPVELPRRLFEAIRQLLHETVSIERTILFLDDIHWADETTIAALEYLRRRWDRGSLTIALSLRPEAVAPTSKLARFLSDLSRREETDHLELSELSARSAEALVSSIADHSLAITEQKALASLGGRIPFFLIELTLEHMAGRLSLPGRGAEGITIPLSLQQVLEQRLDDLAPPADLVLKTLAVFMRPARVQDLTRIAELPEETCVTALEQLQALRLLQWCEDGVRLRHELIRHAVYSSTGEASRRWLHGKVAEHFLTHEPLPVDQLALHFFRAKMKGRALGFALDAAEKAESTGGVPEALGFLEIASECSCDPAQKATILGRLAHLHYLHRDFTEAAPLLDLAVDTFRSQGRVEDALSSETERVDALSQRESRTAEALGELQRIKLEARKHGLWEVAARALDVEIRLLARAGLVDGAAQVLDEARDCIEQGGEAARCVAHRTLAFHLYFGSPSAALFHSRESVRLAEEHQLESEHLLSLNRLVVVLLCQGLLESADGQAALQKGEGAAARSGDVYARFNLRSNLGVWFLDKGDFAGARSAFRRAADVIQNTEARWAHLSLLCNQGELNLLEGDIESAETCFRDAEVLLAPGTTQHAYRLVEAGLGACALQRGALSEARWRGERLDPLPTQWFHDPTLIVVFRARMAETRGNRTEALGILSSVASQIEGRLLLNWLNIKYEEARLIAKDDQIAARRLAAPASQLAGKLGLEAVQEKFSRFL